MGIMQSKFRAEDRRYEGMAKPGELESLNDIIHWAYSHDGRIDAWWEAQHAWNAKMETQASLLQQAVHLNERKIIFAAGCASGVTGFVGALVGVFIGKVFY